MRAIMKRIEDILTRNGYGVGRSHWLSCSRWCIIYLENRREGNCMDNFIIGIAFILFGIVYLINPNIFKRWFWKKTSLAQRSLSPENYQRYMRILGVLYILGGIAFAISGLVYHQSLFATIT